MAVIENIKIEGDASKLIDAIDQLNKRVGELEGQLKDVNTGVKDLGKTGNSVSKAVGGIGTALKGIGIGVFIAAFDQLKEVFTGNQKVMDIFNTLLNTLKILFNDLAESVLPPVSKLLNSIFSDPVQSIKDFGSAIQNYVLNFFDQILSSVGHLGSALANLFTGDFAGALEQVKLAGADAVDALVGVEEGGIEAVKNVAKKALEYAKNLPNQIKEAVNSAQALVELEKAAQLAAVQRQKIQLEYQRSAEVLRQLRDDETKSIDERIKANADLLALLEEQTAKEREQIAIQVAFARAEYEKNKTTENLVTLRQAELELIDLSERLEGQRSEALSNQNSLLREQLDLMKSQRETALDVYQLEQEANLVLINNELERAQKQMEIDQSVYDSRVALLESQAGLYAEGTQARIDAENEIAQLEAEHNVKRLEYEKTLRDARFESEQAKLQMVADGLSAISQLSAAFADDDEKSKKKQFELQKKLSLASAIVAGIQAVQNAYKTAQGSPYTLVNPAYPYIQAGLASAFAVAQVASIARSQYESPSASISSGVGGGMSAPSASPSFNVVGQSGINQLAESIGQQNRQPMRAYVVGSDVTSSQELERKRIKTATFG
jgi:hypothetical protein